MSWRIIFQMRNGKYTWIFYTNQQCSFFLFWLFIINIELGFVVYKNIWQSAHAMDIQSIIKEGPEEGGSYSHFPAQILTKSHCPRAQIPSSQWLSCSNLNPIPIFYCFFADESQSQCMKSHFPTEKWANPSSHFTPSGPLLNTVNVSAKAQQIPL